MKEPFQSFRNMCTKEQTVMKKVIYHGSERILRDPSYHGGKPYNDYGYGFYCTESEEMAKEWAVTQEHDGYANCYEIRTDGLRVLDLNSDFTILTWLAVLICNRTFSLDTPLAREACRYLKDNFYIETSEYDIVTGYRADDNYFSFAQDFVNGTISYEQLRKAMYLGGLGMQYVLISRESFSRLAFVRTMRALRADWLERKMSRDRNARKEYLCSDRMAYRRGELYVTKILDEEMKPDDPRLK